MKNFKLSLPRSKVLSETIEKRSIATRDQRSRVIPSVSGRNVTDPRRDCRCTLALVFELPVNTHVHASSASVEWQRKWSRDECTQGGTCSLTLIIPRLNPSSAVGSIPATRIFRRDYSSVDRDPAAGRQSREGWSH